MYSRLKRFLYKEIKVQNMDDIISFTLDKTESDLAREFIK